MQARWAAPGPRQRALFYAALAVVFLSEFRALCEELAAGQAAKPQENKQETWVCAWKVCYSAVFSQSLRMLLNFVLTACFPVTACLSSPAKPPVTPVSHGPIFSCATWVVRASCCDAGAAPLHASQAAGRQPHRVRPALWGHRVWVIVCSG